MRLSAAYAHVPLHRYRDSTVFLQRCKTSDVLLPLMAHFLSDLQDGRAMVRLKHYATGVAPSNFLMTSARTGATPHAEDTTAQRISQIHSTTAPRVEEFFVAFKPLTVFPSGTATEACAKKQCQTVRRILDSVL